MANEVHDIVGHALVAIQVQASAAAQLQRRNPGTTSPKTMDGIAATAAEALADLRSTLTTLRTPAESAPLHPAQDVTELRQLLHGVEAAGLGVRLAVGPPVPDTVSPAVAHAGYRIVQEGLTNVLRHSTARFARVRVEVDGAEMIVEVADDHPLVRAGFRSILSTEDDMVVVGDARDGVEAVAMADHHAPDVVLMDIRMPRLDGLEATRRITTNPRLANTRVIVLTTFDLDEYVFGALRAGASGFLLKGIEADALIEAVRTVDRGDALLDPGATRRLIEAYVARDDPRRNPAPVLSPLLTAREIEIVKLVARGLTNAEIGALLQISALTCKSHVSSVLTKLDARDRTQLVVLAYESGLVVPGESDRTEPLAHLPE